MSHYRALLARSVCLAATSGVVVAALATSTASAASRSARAASSQVPLSLWLNFTPWAMHNYIYAAQKQGYFTKNGLTVSVHPSAEGSEQAMSLVATGKADVALASSDLVYEARAQGEPLVVIAMDEPINPNAFIYLKKSGIKKPSDLEGKTVCAQQAGNGTALLKAALVQAHVNVKRVNFINVTEGGLTSLLIAGKCQASEGFYDQQPYNLAAQGLPAGALNLSEMGLQFPGMALVTSEHDLKTKRTALIHFVNALAQGHMYAYTHVTAATKYTISTTTGQKLGPNVIESKGLYDTYRTAPTFKGRWGAMSNAEWVQGDHVMVRAGLVPKRLKIQDLFTNSIVDAASATAQFAQLFHKQAPKG